MEWIVGGRPEGKTVRLLQLSAQTGAYIVCASHAEAVRLREEAERLWLPPIPFPLTYAEFRRAEFYGKAIPGFLIDNAEQLLQAMCKEVPLLAAVATTQDARSWQREKPWISVPPIDWDDTEWKKITMSSAPQKIVDGKD